MIAANKNALDAFNELATVNDGSRASCGGYGGGYGYRNFSSSRFHSLPGNMSVTGCSSDYHLRDEIYYRSIEVGRALDREHLVIGAAVTRILSNLFQETGFEPEPQTGNDMLDAALSEEVWMPWANDPRMCDSQQENDFNQMSRLAARHVIVDGDVFGNPLNSGRLQMIENHRVRSSWWNTGKRRRLDTVLGVRLSKERKRLTYYVTKDDVSPLHRCRWSDLRAYGAWDSEGNKNFFHCYLPSRISQTRGVTVMAPIVPVAVDHDDINLAQLIKQKVTASYVVFREQEIMPRQKPAPSRDPINAQQEITGPDGWRHLVEKVSPATEVVGKEGQKLQGFNPQLPVPTYFDHIRLVLTYISINLDLPLIVLLMDASETNFSGWRGVMDQARQRFRQLQYDFIDRWHRPIYHWQVRRALNQRADLRRLASTVPDPFKHTWRTPGWRYIEPFKDTQADILAWQGGMNSPQRLAANKGNVFSDIQDEVVRANGRYLELAMQEAERLNGLFPGQDITYREVLSLPFADNVNAYFDMGDKEPTREPMP